MTYKIPEEAYTQFALARHAPSDEEWITFIRAGITVVLVAELIKRAEEADERAGAFSGPVATALRNEARFLRLRAAEITTEHR